MQGRAHLPFTLIKSLMVSKENLAKNLHTMPKRSLRIATIRRSTKLMILWSYKNRPQSCPKRWKLLACNYWVIRSLERRAKSNYKNLRAKVTNMWILITLGKSTSIMKNELENMLWHRCLNFKMRFKPTRSICLSK